MCEDVHYYADTCVWTKTDGPDGLPNTADDVWKAKVAELSHTDTCTPGLWSVDFYYCEDVCGPGLVANCGEVTLPECGGRSAGHCECDPPPE